ncbi:MAG TPA: IpaD/SipD/SspD family type III secretion system needle tip protein [Burkholderiaceae bacterium]|jgi:invasin D|nr:IpaD/SipD/SspD family type III secretion system needle tip protein [Burkholderiaceae bacterium]
MAEAISGSGVSLLNDLRRLAEVAAQESTTPAQDNAATPARPGPLRPPTSGPLANSPKSDWAFLQNMNDRIGDINKAYVGTHAQVVEKYTQLFSELVAVSAKVGDAVSANPDKENEMRFKAFMLREELQSILDRWASQPLAGPMPADQVEYWRSEFGIKGSGGQLFADMDPITKMRDQLPVPPPLPPSFPSDFYRHVPVTWDNARFQAWQTGFNGLKEQVQTKVTELSQKYQRSLEIFDKLVQILSSTTEAMIQSGEKYLGR